MDGETLNRKGTRSGLVVAMGENSNPDDKREVPACPRVYKNQAGWSEEQGSRELCRQMGGRTNLNST